VPEERQASAQGILGAAQAVMAGVMAAVTGAVYQQFGRTSAYLPCAAVMVVLVATGAWLARSAWALREAPIRPGTSADEPSPAAVSDR
jgi:hypothetical protein